MPPPPDPTDYPNLIAYPLCIPVKPPSSPDESRLGVPDFLMQ